MFLTPRKCHRKYIEFNKIWNSDGENPFDEKQEVQEESVAETKFAGDSESTKLLLDCNRIYMRRPKDPDQILIAHDVAKKFEILDQNGAPMFYAVQEDSCCSR